MGVMDNAPTRLQYLFIVRLWSETGNGGLAQWRGSVENMATRQKFYFTSLGDLSDFIALQLAAPSQLISNKKETI